MNLSRRNLCLWLTALMAPAGVKAQDRSLPSGQYKFEELPVRGSGNFRSRPILEGDTHEGWHIEMHESDLAPGGMPHPAHRHQPVEIFLIREGTLEVTIAGRSSRLGPGSVAYVASNEEHGARNAGDTHTEYFVVALGRE